MKNLPVIAFIVAIVALVVVLTANTAVSQTDTTCPFAIQAYAKPHPDIDNEQVSYALKLARKNGCVTIIANLQG